MSVREDLDALKTRHVGIETVVLSDLSSGMALYSASSGQRSQEDYDSMVALGARAFDPSKNPLADLAGPAAPGMQVAMRGADGFKLFVRSQKAPDEALLFELNALADVLAIGEDAAATLAQFAQEG